MSATQQDETVFMVNAEPFAVPSRYRVVRGEPGGSQQAHIIRVALADQDAAASTVDLRVRRFVGVTDSAATPREVRCLFLRFLKLHTNIPPAFAHVLPIVDVYTSTNTPGDVYCVFPSTQYTLGDVSTVGEITAEQILALTRYLLKALRNFSVNNIAVTNLRPQAVAIDPDLSRPEAVLLSDLSRCVAIPPSTQRQVVLGTPEQVAAAQELASGAVRPTATAAGRGGAGAGAASPQATASKPSASPAAGAAARGGNATAGEGSSSFLDEHAKNPAEDGHAVLRAATHLVRQAGVDLTVLPSQLAPASETWYAAPEIVLGASSAPSPASTSAPPTTAAAAEDRPITAAVDSWSLGCIVFELATKQRLISARDREGYVDAIADLFGGEEVDYPAALGDTPWVRRVAEVAKARTGSGLASRLAGVDQRIRYVLARLLRINPAERALAHELIRLPHLGGSEVPLANFIGVTPGAGGSGGTKATTSTQRAAEAAAAAAAASAPLVLDVSEFIRGDWAMPLAAEDAIIAAETRNLLQPQQVVAVTPSP